MNPQLERALTKAKFQLISEQPFFGYMLLSLKTEETNHVPTMGTDGVKLYINSEFAMSLKPYEFKFILAHEILHMVYKHHLRGPVQMSPREFHRRLKAGQTDELGELLFKHKKWNVAGDLIINASLKNDFRMRWPTTVDPLYNKKYDDVTEWTTEKVYRDIPDPQCQNCGKSQAKAPSNGGCSCEKPQKIVLKGAGEGNYGQGSQDIKGELIGDAYAKDGKKLSKAEQAKAEADMDTKIIQAGNHAKKQGKLPANMERYVQGLTEYSVDYKELLRQFLERTMNKSDYDWRMPNKRYACQQGIYLPSLWGEQEELEDACIFVDTSGSMSQQELKVISGHLGHMLELFNLNLHIVYCDTQVAHVETLNRDDLLADGLKLEAKGGGGTDFRPPFNYIEENDIRPKFAIYFTDLCCSSYPDEPEFPVFWGFLKGAWGGYGEPPFGEVVEIDINGDGDE